jgi:hypothetical protein
VIERTGGNALSSNAWESEINLENDTTYYWKVKARSDKSVGTWSAVGVFTTESVLPTTAAAEAPQSTTDSPPQPTLIVSTMLVDSPNTPQPVNVNINIPPSVIFGLGALLGVIVITLAALVVTSLRRRH